MLRKVLIVTSVLLVILGASVYFVTNWKSSTLSHKQASAKNQDIIERSVSNRNPDLCKKSKGYVFEARDYTSKISAKEAEYNCYREFAIETEQIDQCEKITKDDIYARCVLEVQQAMGKFAERHCDKIDAIPHSSTALSSCAESLVKQEGDKKICDKYFKKSTGSWRGCVFASGEDPADYY